ncbi:hypothetical protein DFA_09127 [Cavenderia fasciculata]|uniref:Calcineurin-like phosphoesterase domain-containing protein n=1 Tax=Cavenderia fasciculata TaxID=261658 RepID=F4Q6S0_CACFS|nr:uncharacterized protein DFA_09127 [Cavenderia fasciculata]EGG16580.1 hypothetical protein DFA_09127 [Cavenderia fasciculata]|eukprot:XP_004354980.1 hypothetical protein DFA_09127 [Cavenderia fasciculata]
MTNIYLTYRTIFFLLFSLLPLAALVILFVIRYLFYDKSKHHPNSKVHVFFDVIKLLVVCGVVLAMTATSTWQYLHVALVIVPSFIFLVVMSLHHLKSRYYEASIFDPVESMMMDNLGGRNQDSDGVDGPLRASGSIKFDEFIALDSKQDDDDGEEDGDNTFDPSYDGGKKTKKLKSCISFSPKCLVKLAWWKQFGLDVQQVIKTSPKKLVVSLSILILLVGVAMPLMMDRMCVCSHPMTLSTRMTRSPSCQNNQVCISYLLLPEDPSQSMIFYFHTRDRPEVAYIKYQEGKVDNTSAKAADSLLQTVEAQSMISMTSTIVEENRWVVGCYLDQLNPATLYSFSMCYITKSSNNESICTPISRFKTLPNDSSPITFVQGGDIQLNNQAIDMATQSLKFNPNFVIIGGDIAYAEGIPACYQRWDQKLKFLTDTYSNITEDGLTLPFLMAIGNHEAGGFFQTSKQVPFYLNYFVFAKQDMLSSPRPTYHHHILGNYSSLTVLDSCIVSTWADQRDWLKSKWDQQQLPRHNRLIVYHVPIYPGNDGKKHIHNLGRSDIVPLFDQYNVTLVMENHEHIFKRTFALEGGQVKDNNDEGTIYVGGGAFGIGHETNTMETASADNLPQDLEKRSRSNHLWIVTITPTNIAAIAINSNGKSIDQFSKSVNQN